MGKKSAMMASSARGRSGGCHEVPEMESLKVTSLVKCLEIVPRECRDDRMLDIALDAARELSQRVFEVAQVGDGERSLIKKLCEENVCKRLLAVAEERHIVVAAAAMGALWEIVNNLNEIEAELAKDLRLLEGLSTICRRSDIGQVWNDHDRVELAFATRRELANKVFLRLDTRAKSWWFNGGKDTQLARELTDGFCALIKRFQTGSKRDDHVRHRIASVMVDADELEASPVPREDLLRMAIDRMASVRMQLETEEEICAELEASALFLESPAQVAELQARFEAGIDATLLQDAKALRIRLAGELLARRKKHLVDGDVSDDEDVEVDEEICNYCGACSEPLVINMGCTIFQGKKEGGKHTIAGKEFSRCGGCHTRYYCSTECSRNDWNSHKVICECLRIQSGYGPPAKSRLAKDDAGRKRLADYSESMRLAGHYHGHLVGFNDQMVQKSLLPLLQRIADGTVAFPPIMTTLSGQQAGVEKARIDHLENVGRRKKTGICEGMLVAPTAEQLSDARIIQLADEVLRSCPDLGCKGIHKRLGASNIQVSVHRLKRLGYSRG